MGYHVKCQEHPSANALPARWTAALLPTPCKHDKDFCPDCLKRHAETALEDGAVLKGGIQCAAFGCCQVVPEECILSVLKPSDQQKFRRWRRVAAIQENPNLRWCPRPGCEKAIDLASTTICECSAEVCADCGSLSHPGQQCAEAADAGLNALVKTMGWMRCPHCGKVVERTDGCDSMRCVYLNCGKLFCYSCGKKRDVPNSELQRCLC
jgi:hypothetical protein